MEHYLAEMEEDSLLVSGLETYVEKEGVTPGITETGSMHFIPSHCSWSSRFGVCSEFWFLFRACCAIIKKQTYMSL